MLSFPHKINNEVTLNMTVVRYMVLAGTQITIHLDLPYCDDCTKSAKRKAVGLIKKLLMSAVLAQKVVAANPEAISSGALEVATVR